MVNSSNVKHVYAPEAISKSMELNSRRLIYMLQPLRQQKDNFDGDSSSIWAQDLQN
jgi:hypothetical protein